MGTKSKKKTVNPDYLEIEHLLTIARRTSGIRSARLKNRNDDGKHSL